MIQIRMYKKKIELLQYLYFKQQAHSWKRYSQSLGTDELQKQINKNYCSDDIYIEEWL